MQDDIHLSLTQARNLSHNTLTKAGFSNELASAVTETLVACERDGCKSHGLYRLLVCVKTLRAGKVNPVAEPLITRVAPALLKVDADQGYSLLALEKAADSFTEMVKQQGIAAMVINRCVHFSAMWYDVEKFTDRGLVALAMTPSHAWVAPAGGTRPLFGTNPIAFGWPRVDGDPYVFDFATSAIARGDLELHRRDSKTLSPGLGIDKEGQPSTDPAAVMEGAMLTFGGYKGSALATMVELLAGALINDFTSPESLAFDAGTGSSPMGGELIIAMDPLKFMGETPKDAQQKAESIFTAITDQGARLPSQRRFTNRKVSVTEGITLDRKLYEDIVSL
ncbi:TPA: Ldh family oxidoreductase [Klebsiella pneumoniae]|nr:Ldh family oxidoreductase [Klebsiella pneumoniae]